MTVAAAAAHLPRFANGSAPEIASAGFRLLTEKPAPPPMEDRQAAQAAAVAAALEAAAAEFAATRAADRTEFERRLAERESDLLASIGQALSAQLAEGLAAIEEQIGAHVAAVLLRFLDSAVRERAVSELTEAVAALAADGDALRIRVAAPAELVERLQAAMAPTKTAVEWTGGTATEVSVSIDDTIVETNVTAWLDRLMPETGGAADG